MKIRIKKFHYLIAGLFPLVASCTDQSAPQQDFYSQDFNWAITIPAGFEKVDAAQWAKLQNKGADAIEQTIDTEVVNNSKTLFVFRSDQSNYFESSYQPYDVAVDGDYKESCKAINEVLYETFMAQMEGIKIDTVSAVEKIDGLDFQVFNMKVLYPNNMVLHASMFSRLFDKKELSVNIMYVDENKGSSMLKTWKSSTFSKAKDEL